MKTSHHNSSWARISSLALAVVTLSSCSMPPRQAWNMIQREGLLNYWAYATGHRPMYATRSSPPLMSGTPHSLAYRPPYARYGEGWAAGHSMAPRYHGYSPVPNRYYSTSPAPGGLAGASSPRIATTTKSSAARRSTKPRSSAPKPRPLPDLAIKLEEPAPPPVAASSAPTAPPTDASQAKTQPSSPPAPAAKTTDLPYGSPVPGRPNMVTSPYASKSQLVDVAGMGAGQTVKCPYSGKLFKVPPSQQAAAKTESSLESKNTPQPSSSGDSPQNGQKQP